LAVDAAKFGLCLWGFCSLLFDNCIGRKRDVGGGVLAGLRSLSRILGRELKEPIWRFESEETTDGHVSKIHRASRERAPDRREAGRPHISVEADVFGTRQEYNVREDIEVTSRDQISVELESLILAQNERWRQA
jgi:hypothetical protein